MKPAFYEHLLSKHGNEADELQTRTCSLSGRPATLAVTTRSTAVLKRPSRTRSELVSALLSALGSSGCRSIACNSSHSASPPWRTHVRPHPKRNCTLSSSVLALPTNLENS